MKNQYELLAALENGDSMDTEVAEGVLGGLECKDSDSGEDLFKLEFEEHKKAYYIDKFEVADADELVFFFY